MYFQPLFASKTVMPHRATFPFDTSDTSSFKFIGAYIFQSIIFVYLIQGITFVDNIGVCTLNESLLHVRVVAHKFSQLRFISNGNKGAIRSSTRLEYEQLIACIKEHQQIFEYLFAFWFHNVEIFVKAIFFLRFQFG